MARKPDIQYVGQFYVHGNAAPQRELKPLFQPSKINAPKFLKKDKVEILVDPVALASTVVAVVLLVMMVVNCFQYVGAVRAYDAMEERLVELRDENARLNHDYHTSDDYDLEYVEKTALALGLVGTDEVEHISIRVTPYQPDPDPTVWDDIQWFLDGLFA